MRRPQLDIQIKTPEQIEKMRAAGVHQAAIDTFSHYYEQLEAGESVETIKKMAF